MSAPRAEDARFRERFHEYADTLDCVHCGLCLPDCPTYEVTGREADSPRGRIYLMRGYAEERFDVTDEAMRHLDQCIVCRACESVCPSGIRMGEMMESFRDETNRRIPSGIAASRIGRFLFRELLPFRGRIAALSDVLGLYQRSGLDRAAGALLRRVAPGLARAHAMQPRIPPRAERRVPTERERPEGFPAEGTRRARVALFLGCVASEWFAPVHRATIRVLRKNGCDVIVPWAQTCCGALQRHAGMLDDARPLERANARAFARTDLDAIVVNAAGCGAALKEPLGGPAGLPPVRDVCELLGALGLAPPDRTVRRRVAYDQPCHLLHGQGIGKDVVEGLLAQVPGLELVPLTDSERCCGAGGVYNLLHPEMAERVLEAKVRTILDCGADTVVTGNPGCAMQFAHGLAGTSIEVRHPVEILNEGYGEAASDSGTGTGTDSDSDSDSDSRAAGETGEGARGPEEPHPPRGTAR